MIKKPRMKRVKIRRTKIHKKKDPVLPHPGKLVTGQDGPSVPSVEGKPVDADLETLGSTPGPDDLGDIDD